MDLHEVARRSFQTIRGRLAGALVYLDTGAGETAAHSLGARFFFDLGASNVCELKTACSQDAALPLLIGQAYPVVIFITQLLTTAQEQILKAVKAHPSATGVTVFCSYSVDAHPNLSGAVIGSNAYADFEQMLQKEADWRNQGLDDKDEAREAMIDARQQELYQRSGQEASVRYFPFQLCAVTGRTFVLPSTCAAVQTRSGGIPAGFGDYDEKSNQAGDAINLGDTANAVSLIGHTLSGVASQLGVKFDTYTLGPFSQRIGKCVVEVANSYILCTTTVNL
ncbi:unnamed protein product [Ostreobium quekettii]|uniref:Uncharacterized protein n=1 Tax=Ostreobium quekettii TaxID=121088 RepID=A0A8S1J073_9CHLO|nr:unnamed protein product [Ostreobium quekettii]